MKAISKKLFYNDDYLDNKIPDSVKILGNNNSDYPFLILDNLLTEKQCDTIVENLLNKGSYGNVKISPTAQEKESSVNKNIRNTQAFSMNSSDKELYLNIMKNAKIDIEDFFKIKLSKSEGLQTLGYGKGSFYKLHCDNCRPDFENGKFVKWTLTKDYRKITTILFITESSNDIVNNYGSFKGGELTFDYLKDSNNNPVTIYPKKGMLIAFPSNPYFSHTVKNVDDGYRISLVEWYDGEWQFPLPSCTYSINEISNITFNTNFGDIILSVPSNLSENNKLELIESIKNTLKQL